MEVGTTQSGPENAWVQLAQIGKEGSYYISCPNGQGYLAGQLKKLEAWFSLPAMHPICRGIQRLVTARLGNEHWTWHDDCILKQHHYHMPFWWWRWRKCWVASVKCRQVCLQTWVPDPLLDTTPPYRHHHHHHQYCQQHCRWLSTWYYHHCRQKDGCRDTFLVVRQVNWEMVQFVC